MIEKTCGGCGTAVQVEIPPGLSETYRTFMERLGAMCDECADKNEVERERAEKEQKRIEYLDRVRASRLPQSLIGLDFTQLDSTENESRAAAVKAAEAWGQGDLKGLVLSGPVGVGKSRMAGAATNLRLWYRMVDWVSVPALIVAMKAGFGTKERQEASKLLIGGNALVLDDLDKVKPSDFAVDVLFQAIEQRVNRQAPLLVTTNLHGDEIAKLLGDPIRSRLSGYCKAVWIDGRDRRRSP